MSTRLLLLLRNTAVLIVTSLTLCGTAMAQINFGNSEVALSDLSAGSVTWSVLLSQKGLVFDYNLTLTNWTTTGIGLNTSGSIGFDAPHSGGGTANEEIDIKGGAVACGLLHVVVNSTASSHSIAFDLDMTDAIWGANDASVVYKLWFYYENGDWHVQVLNQQGGIEGNAIHIVADGLYKYWNLVNDATQNYTRERTSSNGYSFTIPEGELPMSSTGITDALLDVNVNVTGDAVVPAGSTLRIESDPDQLPLSTTLKFSAYKKFTVYGQILVNEQFYPGRNSYGVAYFTAPDANQTPGYWLGITCISTDALMFRNCHVLYGQYNLKFNTCSDVITENLTSSYSSEEGLTSLSTDGLYLNTTIIYNSHNGVRVSRTGTAHFINGTVGYTTAGAYAGNGFVVELGGTAIIDTMDISNNASHGVITLTQGDAKIRGCSIRNNGTSVDPPEWDGVHCFYNGARTSIQYSRVAYNDVGIRLNHGSINGFFLAASDTAYAGLADSLGLNCIHYNRYNLYSDYGTFLFAVPYYDGQGDAHFLGGYNTIDNGSVLDGYFYQSKVYLAMDYTGISPTWDIQSCPTFLTAPSLSQPATLCATGRGTNDPSILEEAQDIHNPQLVTLDAQLRALTSAPSALRCVVLAAVYGYSSGAADIAFAYVLNSSQPSDAALCFQQILGMSGLPAAVQELAWKYKAIAHLKCGQYSAAQACSDQAVGFAQSAPNSAYTAGHAFSAYMMHYDGRTQDGLTRLSQVLAIWPDDHELQMAWFLIGGGALPKTPVTQETLVSGLVLNPAYPNPFNPTTTISITLPHASYTSLCVLDALGRRVATLYDEYLEQGTHQVVFDAKDVPSGTYFYKLIFDGHELTRKMSLVK